MINPRTQLSRYLAPPERLKHARAMRWLGQRLHDPALWHVGRRTVAGGVGLGFFLALIPLPTQMLIGAPLALLLRVNLPVTMAAIWLTNPLTILPLFYVALKIGMWICGSPDAIDFDRSMAGLGVLIEQLWLPFTLGCVVSGIIAGSVGYATVNVLWRWQVSVRWNRRARQLEPDRAR